ncbi:MFS transporter [Desulfatiglans anilini]|uniref:MFS transporter n=1 Tax=Desulfatiglans anilini TaxID=90728 RepID=UPI0004123D9F|nr:MFS transporter [Desulfatiglans anilini]
MPSLPYKWKALLTVAMGTMMATMDASITTIAFPELTRVFRTDLPTVMWVMVGYILVSSSLMLVVGKLSDSVGRSRIYTTGIAVFTLGLMACGLAQSIAQLVLFRLVQAIGAAMCVSCGTAIVTEAFPAAETGRGLGLLSISVSLGFILGPFVGGILLEWLDWRALFYVRIPVGLCTLIMAIVLLKKDTIQPGRIRLDILGTVVSSAAIFCLVFGMGLVKTHGPASPVVLFFLGTGIMLLIVFIWVERRAVNPIVDLTLFKNKTLSYAMAGLFLFFLAGPAYVLLMPFYLLEALRLSPLESGMLLAVVSASTLIASPVSGAVSDRIGRRWPSSFGAAAAAAAFFCMLGFDLETQVWAIIPVLVLLGLGVGAFQPPNNSTIMSAAGSNHLGSASALIATERQVGISLGMALASAIFSARQEVHQNLLHLQGMDAAHVLRASIPPAFQDALLAAFILSLGVLAFALFSPRLDHAAEPR